MGDNKSREEGQLEDRKVERKKKETIRKREEMKEKSEGTTREKLVKTEELRKWKRRQNGTEAKE